ncbi:MAG: hypothetical protein ACP5G2_08360 [Candidatus Bipolaricaulaceae bacterium]
MRPFEWDVALPRTAARPWATSGPWLRVAVAVGCGALVAGLVFLYLWQGCHLTFLRAERARVLLTLEELERTRQHLEFQVQCAYSPQAVAERAQELGMRPFDPDRTGYLDLEDETAGH